jgi:purine-binding chemotaxis protein CheW
MNKNSGSAHISILTFVLDGQEYGLPVADVVQIIEIVSLTQLLQAPKAVRGVFNMRGQITPVVDLRLRFDLPEALYQLHTPIILVMFNGRPLGLIVDTVNAVVEVSPTDLLDSVDILPPELAAGMKNHISLDYLLGIAKVDRQLLPILCVAKILNADEQAEAIAV